MLKKLVMGIIVIAAYFIFIPKDHLATVIDPLIQAESGRSGLKIVETTDPYLVAEYGMFTIVEFYTDACSTCKKLKTYYEKFLPLRPDVAVRRIKLPNNWSTESAKGQYNLDIRGTPHILIYDDTKSLLIEDDGNDWAASKLVWEWIGYTLNNNG